MRHHGPAGAGGPATALVAEAVEPRAPLTAVTWRRGNLIGADVLENLPIAVLLVDDTGVVVYWNRRATEIYGWTAEEIVGLNAAALRIGPRPTEMLRTLREVHHWEGELDGRRKDGTKLPVYMTISTVKDDESVFRGYICTSFDLSLRKRLQEDLAFNALHDYVTGLPNRRLFLDRLEATLARMPRLRSKPVVLCVGIEELTQVNDALGHTAGDELLIALAQRLQASVPSGDDLARIASDELAVCHYGARDEQDALALARQLGDEIGRPMHLRGMDLLPTVRIGVAVAAHGADPQTVLRQANAAMHRARDRGHGGSELFDEALEHEAREALYLSSQLDHAVARDEIVVVYEPQVSLLSGELIGVEALARWRHPTRGLLPPSSFVHLAERSRSIRDIGRAVLETAWSEARAWDASGEGISVAVNLSALELSDGALVDTISGVLRDVPSEHTLCLEITESALLEHVDRAADVFRSLKDLGVTIAIDDFGTGYSSLARLKRLPIDLLKIDRTFVDGLGTDPEDHAIVAAIVRLARSLGLDVLAEGVQNETQIRALQAMGCTRAQGHYWSPPVTADEIGRLVGARPSPVPPAGAGPA